MKCYSPISVKFPGQDNVKIRTVVPCGKCSACLMNRRDEWIFRIKEEAKAYIENIFVTLTYDDEHLPYGQRAPTLVKRDLQNFIKRIRHHTDTFRYYALGEYGGNTLRPHYHLIIFNHGVDFYQQIFDDWKNGFVYVSPLTPRRIGYICKYHLNVGDRPKGSAPSFTQMSTKPAIGSTYVKRMWNFHRQSVDRAYYSDEGVKRCLPRYYRNKLYSKEEREVLSERMKDDFAIDVVEKFHVEHPKTNYFLHKQDTFKALQERYNRLKHLNQKL